MDDIMKNPQYSAAEINRIIEENLTKLGIDLGLLGENVLDLGDDIGRALDKIGDLIDGIGLALHTHIDEFYVAVAVYYQKANGNDTHAGSAAATKVLGTGRGIFLLGIVIHTARGDAHRDLGDRDDGSSGIGDDGVTHDGVGIHHGANVCQRGADDFGDLVCG